MVFVLNMGCENCVVLVLVYVYLEFGVFVSGVIIYLFV